MAGKLNHCKYYRLVHQPPALFFFRVANTVDLVVARGEKRCSAAVIGFSPKLFDSLQCAT